MNAIQIQYTGNKARVGGLCFDQRGHMNFFVGYCPDCRSRIQMDRSEAEQFANKFYQEKHRRKNRILLKAIDKLSENLD